MKNIITKAFLIIEETYGITYTKKYTKEYLIKGFSQTELDPRKWFKVTDIGKQINRMLITKTNKKQSETWRNYLIRLTGYKWCYNCKEAKLMDEFSNKTNSFDGKHSQCKLCDGKESKKYRNENPEKVKETRKNTYEKKKKDDPTYFKRKNALARRRLKQRTPKWLSEEEKIAIQDFYANCPEGYHVDHIIPLNGKDVSGLHVLINLQYLTAKGNQIKNNKFNIE